FSRLDSFFTISTQRNLYVSRLFLASLVPSIDKPWGNTLREKLHEPCACGIQIGALRSVNSTYLYKHGRGINFIQPYLVLSLFHFLLYVAKGSSSLNFREKQTILNRISNLARVNLRHTLGVLSSHS